MLAASAPSAQDDLGNLPEGEGKPLLIAYCISCHVLEEVTKFDGYYGEAQWREVVITMATYGTPVPEGQIPVLVAYLAENYGPETLDAR